MIYAAQIDPATQELKQGLAFSTAQMAEGHFAAHPEFVFISTGEFVSPETHQYLDGQIVRKA